MSVPKETIVMFPDSGHHYCFIPIDLSVFGSNKEHIQTKCAQKKSPWGGVDAKPWLRFRFAQRYKKGGKDEPGIWVSVETNLGDVTRGSILTPQEPVEKRPWPGQSPSPYARETILDLPEESFETIPLQYEIDNENIHFCSLELRWARPVTEKPIDVDLVIDFGNTRTVALLLEYVPNPPGSPAASLISLIKPVNFIKYNEITLGTQSDSHIIDSWFVLQETEFAAFEPPYLSEKDAIEERIPGLSKSNFFSAPAQVLEAVIKRVPQRFVELAPVVLAGEAQQALTDFEFERGGICFLSSPKRYAWDSKLEPTLRPVAWTMHRVDKGTSEGISDGQNLMLARQVLRFFPSSGSDWEINDPPTMWASAHRPHAAPVMPTFPRADALSWMALAIIEQAYRQINSMAHMKDNFPFVRRQLRSIIVTHPSGWTGAELKAYKAKWRKALNCFAYGHLANPISEVPKLEFPIDEAVASQLPIIFGEIQSLSGVGDNWLELVARREATTGLYSARIMSLDIGGGTTDISVLEYRDKMPGPGVHLETKLLFKDSSTIAGDAIVKDLIERLLLAKLRSRFSDDEKYTFDDLFSKGFSSQVNKEKWKRITRLILIPIVTQWLRGVVNSGMPSEDYSDLNLNPHVIAELNQEGVHLGLPDKIPVLDIAIPLDVTTNEINEIIEGQFSGMVEALAKYVASFDIDLVIVSGKPSELPKIKEMLELALPIELDRIIMAKGFSIGNWYPFCNHGRISDAKTVAATGLALYQAIREDRIPQWHIEVQKSTAPTRHYWLLLPAMPGPKPQMVMERNQDTSTVVMMPGTRIARRLLPSSLDPEPTYILRWRNYSKPKPPAIQVTLRRAMSEGPEPLDELVITQVQGLNAENSVEPDDVSLDVCTLNGEEYWIDQARFTPSSYDK